MPRNTSVLRTILLGNTNIFPIATSEGVVLVDSGPNFGNAWNELETGLAEQGYSTQDVTAVLLTHAHGDHTGLAGRLQRRGARIMIHRDEVEHLRAGPEHAEAHAASVRQFLLEHGAPQEVADAFGPDGDRHPPPPADFRPRSFPRRSRRRVGTHQRHSGEPPALHEAALHRVLAREDEFDSPREMMDALMKEAGLSDHGQLWASLERMGNFETLGAFRRAMSHGQRQGSWFGDPVHPDRVLEDGDLLEFDGQHLEAIHCPGHSPGSTVFFHQESGFLFSGDHILSRITPNPTIEFVGGDASQRTRSLPNYLASLQKVRGLPAKRVLGAHGREMRDLEKAVDRLLRHHQRRGERVYKALGKSSRPAFEVMPRVFRGIWGPQIWLAMCEVVGHLDVLEAEGRVLAEHDGGKTVYRTV